MQKIKSFIGTSPKIISKPGDLTHKVEQIDTKAKLSHLQQIIKQTSKGTKLKDQNIVFSGFRDKSLEQFVSDQGGKVNSTVSKNTSFVVIKSFDEKYMKSKVKKAQESGIKIISLKQFIDTYQN